MVLEFLKSIYAMDTKILTLDTAWTAAFDAPQSPFSRSIAIFSTPRTGSQALCRLLYDAGLGIPAEYFHTRLIDSYCARFLDRRPPLTERFMKDYVQAVRTLRSRNGFLSYKIHADQHRHQIADLGEVLEDTLPDISIIRLRRRDVVAQILSLGAALQSGIWEDFSTPNRSEKNRGVSDFAAQKWTEHIFSSERYWDRYMEHTRHRVVTIFHEDFSNLDKMQETLQTLGADHSESTIQAMLDRHPRYSQNAELARDLSRRFGRLISRHWDDLQGPSHHDPDLAK